MFSSIGRILTVRNLTKTGVVGAEACLSGTVTAPPTTASRRPQQQQQQNDRHGLTEYVPTYRTELSIRLAHRIQDLVQTTGLRDSMDDVEQVKSIYCQSSRELIQ
jgi:Mitochondrial branched-chain alpha-ketoacid dehydrogenase kinase